MHRIAGLSRLKVDWSSCASVQRMRQLGMQAGEVLRVPGPGAVFWMVVSGHVRVRSAQGYFRVASGEWIALTAEPAEDIVIDSQGMAIGIVVPPELVAAWFADPLYPVYFMARGALEAADRQRCGPLLQYADAEDEARQGASGYGADWGASQWQHFVSGLQSACRSLSEACPGYSVLRRRQIFIRFQQALMTLQGNPERVIRIAELAKRCNFSFCYFTRVFQLLYGQTPQRIATQHRLERAHALITATGLPIIDVAAECGFENPSSFARAFRAHFGASASTIRISASKRAASCRGAGPTPRDGVRAGRCPARARGGSGEPR